MFVEVYNKENTEVPTGPLSWRLHGDFRYGFPNCQAVKWPEILSSLARAPRKLRCRKPQQWTVLQRVYELLANKYENSGGSNYHYSDPIMQVTILHMSRQLGYLGMCKTTNWLDNWTFTWDKLVRFGIWTQKPLRNGFHLQDTCHLRVFDTLLLDQGISSQKRNVTNTVRDLLLSYYYVSEIEGH